MRITEQPITPAGANAAIPMLLFKVCEDWAPVGHRAIREAKEGDILNVIARHSGTFKGRWRLVRLTRNHDTADRAYSLHAMQLRQGALAWLKVSIPFAYPLNTRIEQFRYESKVKGWGRTRPPGSGECSETGKPSNGGISNV